jgi:hypothetical protein
MMEEKRVCSALALVRRSMRELLLLQLAHHIHHAVEAAPGIAIRNSDMTSRLMLSDLPGRPKTSSMSMLRPKTPKSIWATFALGIESGVSLGAPLLFTPSTNSMAARKTWSASFRLPLLRTPGHTKRGAAQQSVKVRTRRCCLRAEAQWRVRPCILLVVKPHRIQLQELAQLDFTVLFALINAVLLASARGRGVAAE